MRKKIITILCSSLFIASTVQIAAAAEHHKNRKADHVTASARAQFLDSNAYFAGSSARSESDVARYEDGGEAGAPAGR